jgi:hypothetical protein
MVEPALNCFARGCYRFRNTTCTESETDPIFVEILVGVTFIGAIVALGVAYYFLR